MNLPQDVKYIIKTLNEHNYEAFIIGGCVRDIILHKEPTDYDITTSATPIEIKNCFEKTFDTGIKHGTVTVVLNRTNYEVTTYRIDGEYFDNRHPLEVVFTKNLVEDLQRRDFTMNAIAFHEELGFIDPFNGKKDIHNKIIRGVGTPNKRFQEDGLRMMRAIRFSSQLGFTIEENTYNALIHNHLLIKNISIERIRDELLKIIMSNYPNKIILLTNTRLMENIHSYINDYLLKYNHSIINTLEKSPKSELIRLSLFFRFIKDEIHLEEILKFLRFDNKTIKNLKILVQYSDEKLSTDEYYIRKFVYIVGLDTFKTIIQIQKIINNIDDDYYKSLEKIYSIYTKIITNNDCISLKTLVVNGNDLISLGVGNGKEIGNILDNLMDLVLKDPSLNNRDLLLKNLNKV